MTFDQWHKSEFGFDDTDTLSMGASDNRPYQYEARKKAWNAAIAEAGEREQAAVELLFGLVNKLHAIEPHLISMATLAQIHGFRYSGPNYHQELEDSEMFLERLRTAKEPHA